MKAVYWRLLPLTLFALLAFFFWRGLSLNPQDLPSVKLGQSLPMFELPALDQKDAKFTSQTMQGQVALLNVWASWCEACTQEQVFLLQLARQGVVIYGLNYKDSTEDATHWLTEWGNPYKAIGSDTRGQVAIDLGVYGAPETFLIDKAGIIQYRHAGILTTKIWEEAFVPRIAALGKTK